MRNVRENIRCGDMSGAVGYGRYNHLHHHHLDPQHGKGNHFLNIVQERLENDKHRSLPGEALRDEIASKCHCSKSKMHGGAVNIQDWMPLFKVVGKELLKKAMENNGENLIQGKMILTDIIKHIRENANSPVEAVKLFAHDVITVLVPGDTSEAKLTFLTKKLIKFIVAKKMQGRGLSLSGSGKRHHQRGGDFDNFWRGFTKGFKMVFKPGAKILGTVATALGQPEIGIPLNAVSEIL